MKENFPNCPHAPGCRSRKNGTCRVLKNTDFKGKPCPFYKTAVQNAVESLDVRMPTIAAAMNPYVTVVTKAIKATITSKIITTNRNQYSMGAETVSSVWNLK